MTAAGKIVKFNIKCFAIARLSLEFCLKLNHN